MIAAHFLEALLDLWDDLPALVGFEAWQTLCGQIDWLFEGLRTATSEEERALRAGEIALLFQGHPAALRRLRKALEQIRRERGAGEAPLLEWPQEIDSLDGALHPRFATRYTHVLAPRRVQVGTWQAVTVRLTLGPESPASQPLAVEEARDVVVGLRPVSDGLEIQEPTSGTLEIRSGQDSAPLAFLFRGLAPGPKKMLLHFRQDQRTIGEVPVLVEMIHESPEAEAERQILGPVFAARPIPQPVDLELGVFLELRDGKTLLEYSLHSPSQAVDFHHCKIAGPEIVGKVEDFQAKLLAKIEDLQAGKDVDGSLLKFKEVESKLEGIGRDLWEEIFSPEMRRAYRQFCDGARTVQITSEEPYIPWELIKPYDDEGPGEPLDHDFLGCRFQLTRWLAGRKPPAAVVRAGQLACIEAGSAPKAPPLPHAAAERARLAALASAHGLEDASPAQATYAAVESLLKEARTGIFHVVAHGEFSPAQPNESSLRLIDGRSFRAEDLHGPLKTAVLRSRPLVFLNACRVGQQGWSLTGLGGWARRWVEICGCGAFLGPLWAVSDQLAYEFAKTFYDELERGETFGAATQAARQRVRELAPARPTWLAYSVYGHPNGRVVFS